MRITIGKILALLTAGGYAFVMWKHAQGFTARDYGSCVVLLLLLALIWFPEEIDALLCKWMKMETDTPPIFISMIGWIFLLLKPTMALLIG